MIVTRVSQLSGELNEMDLPITKERLDAWIEGNQLIQHAFPELNADQREFLISGITPAEWNEYVGEEEENDIEDLVDDFDSEEKTEE